MTLKSSEFSTISCSAHADSVVASFTAHDSYPDLAVRAACRAPSSAAPLHLQDAVLCRLNVTGVPTSHAVQSVQFPVMAQLEETAVEGDRQAVVELQRVNISVECRGLIQKE